jgi:hypothetical protein
VIDEFLQSYDELKRLRELECRAADAWFDGMSPEQREVFEQLLVSTGDISHLRERVLKARFEAELKQKETEMKRKQRGG